MKCLFLFLAVFLIFPFVNGQAQSICSKGNGIASGNTTTVGTLDLKAAMQGIAYQACYSGDANTNNTVTVQYRQTGTGTFFTASTTVNGQLINPFNDRRATINGVSNRYYQQFRGSIVGLQAGTSYDVQVTFSDPDGVVGGPTLTGTISTVTTTPPHTGSTITVTDDSSFNNALSTVTAGQTIHVNAGNYTGTKTLTVSGNSNNYIVLDCDHAGSARISGGDPNIQINANYVMVQYCDFPATPADGIIIGSGQHDIYIQNNTLDAVNSGCNGGSAIDLKYSSGNIWILNNTIQGPGRDCSPTQLDGDDEVSGQAIDIDDGASLDTTVIVNVSIQNNTIKGIFDDGITQNSANSSPHVENIEVIGNTVQDYKDDGIEFKIMSINHRVIGNTVIGNNATTCFAANSNLQNGQSYGPVYFVRNNCHMSSSVAGAEWKIGNSNNLNEALPLLMFHNSTYENTPDHDIDHFDCEAGAKETIYFINNIYYGQGNYIHSCHPYGEPGAPLGNSLWDYNDVFTCCNGYGFDLNNFNNANPTSFANWQAAGSQDAHSIASGRFPYVSATDLHLAIGSPAIDKGTVINNINDANSAWPYSGAAPDIGAFELSTGSVTASIAATGGTPQSATVNTSFSTALAATVKDASNNLFSGVVVTFTAPASGASGTFTGGLTTVPVITDGNGVATAPTFTANSTVGSYTVTATVLGVGTPANFILTNNDTDLGSPASVTATAGTPQSAAVNTSFLTALAATVKDGSNNLLSGVTVTFTAPATGASGTFTGGLTTATAVTSDSGVATAPTFTANGATGSYAVTASVSGVTTADNFSLTNTAPPGAFSIPQNGGVQWLWSGNSTLPITGDANAQMDTPLSISGIGMIGFRVNGVLVAEAGVSASPLISSGRTYVNMTGAAATGIAFANPTSQNAVISFYFTTTAGIDFGSGAFSLAAGQQFATFFVQAPFNCPPNLEGTFTFSSSSPIGVMALQSLTNQVGNFLYTSIPLAPVAGASPDPVLLAHFADGGGWTTQVILVNPSDSTQTGTMQFYPQGSLFQAAQPISIKVNGQINTTFNYTIPPHTSMRFTTAGQTGDTRSGSVRVIPARGGAPTAAAIFSYVDSGVTVTMASVAGLPTGTAFQTYAEMTGATGQIGSVQTGVAIANPSANSVTVNLQITGLDGSLGPSVPVVVPGNGQIAQFLQNLISALAPNFQGFVTVTSPSPIAFTALRTRYNEVGQFLITTTTPLDQNRALPVRSVVLPQVVTGGGYTTQFVIFGESGTGQLSLVLKLPR